MWASYWTDENVLEVDRSPAAHTHVLFPQLPLSVTSAIPQPLGPRCWWTYLPRKNLSLSVAVLCNSWSSVSLKILSVLLAVTAYDQYKAISNPLLYAVSMSSGMCSLLMAGVYLVGMVDALIHTTLVFHLYSCGSNVINHSFCDLPPLFLLSCSYIQVNELLLFIVFGFIELSTISGVLLLYHPFSLENPLCLGEVQSFLHLYFLPKCGGHFPGNSTLYEFPTNFFLLSRSRQNDLIVLHLCYSHVKPSDL